MIVEPSDGSKLFGFELVRDIVCNAGKALVFHRGKYAVGLIEKEIQLGLAIDLLTVNFYRIIFINMHGSVINDCAVNADFAVLYQCADL